mgnify:CR=1 FL=1
MDILFAQWQGSGPDNILYYGAKKIEQHLNSMDFHEISVPETSGLTVENCILGYKDILSQAKACAVMLKDQDPLRIRAIGGDCGVEPVPVTYLNQKCEGDLALVWFDAHGDLNTPETSPSGHFHGMPLRTICGEGDPGILGTCFSALNPSQVVLAGAREFDPPEKRFIKKNRIPVLSPRTLKENSAAVSDLIQQMGYGHVYIHIDLDVLDPEVYRNIKHPTPGGISIETLLDCITNVSSQCKIAGLGIVEFVPDGDTGLFEIEQIFNLVKLEDLP